MPASGERSAESPANSASAAAESDRAAAVTEMLSSLGADITCGKDEIVIRGGKRLTGTTASSYNDHRMVMCAAAVSLIADGKVTVTEAQAISKSYPGFTDDFTAMGGTFICTEDPV